MKKNELVIDFVIDDEPIIRIKKMLDECSKSAKELGLSKRQIRKLFNKKISTK